jgi:hypothetical protein
MKNAPVIRTARIEREERRYFAFHPEPNHLGTMEADAVGQAEK